MSDILRKFRRGATLLGELIKYEAAALCAGVLKVTNPRYRHVWLCLLYTSPSPRDS